MSILKVLLLLIRNLIHWNWSLTVLYKGKKKSLVLHVLKRGM